MLYVALDLPVYDTYRTLMQIHDHNTARVEPQQQPTISASFVRNGFYTR